MTQHSYPLTPDPILAPDWSIWPSLVIQLEYFLISVHPLHKLLIGNQTKQSGDLALNIIYLVCFLETMLDYLKPGKWRL